MTLLLIVLGALAAVFLPIVYGRWIRAKARPR